MRKACRLVTLNDTLTKNSAQTKVLRKGRCAEPEPGMFAHFRVFAFR